MQYTFPQPTACRDGVFDVGCKSTQIPVTKPNEEQLNGDRHGATWRGNLCTQTAGRETLASRGALWAEVMVRSKVESHVYHW